MKAKEWYVTMTQEDLDGYLNFLPKDLLESSLNENQWRAILRAVLSSSNYGYTKGKYKIKRQFKAKGMTL